MDKGGGSGGGGHQPLPQQQQQHQQQLMMISSTSSTINSTASDLIDAKLEEHNLCGSKQCPECGHKFHAKPDWVGLPAGVKFDPTDQELIEHLEAKAESKHNINKSHPLIDEFIPTIQGEDGICYTHPERLPGVTRDGLSKHFFHRPSKAYTTGTRKRRKIQTELSDQLQQSSTGGETRWHKTGKTRPVLVNGKQKGCKKILVLYTNFGKNRKPEKTNWVMHQYHLGQHEEEKEGELVVSKIFYQTQPRQCNWSSSSSSTVEHQQQMTTKGTGVIIAPPQDHPHQGNLQAGGGIGGICGGVNSTRGSGGGGGGGGSGSSSSTSREMVANVHDMSNIDQHHQQQHHDQVLSAAVAAMSAGYNPMDHIQQHLKPTPDHHFSGSSNFVPFRKGFDEAAAAGGAGGGMQEASTARETPSPLVVTTTCDDTLTLRESRPPRHHMTTTTHHHQQQQPAEHHPHMTTSTHHQQQQAVDHHHHHQLATAAFHISRPSPPISQIISPPQLHHASIILDDDPYHHHHHVPRIINLQNEHSFQHQHQHQQQQHQHHHQQQQQHQVQNQQQQHHNKIGGGVGRSAAAGLEEIIMGCTSSSAAADIKEESSMANQANQQEPDWLKYSAFWHDPDHPDHHG